MARCGGDERSSEAMTVAELIGDGFRVVTRNGVVRLEEIEG